jgi:serine/threonine protein kinase
MSVRYHNQSHNQSHKQPYNQSYQLAHNRSRPLRHAIYSSLQGQTRLLNPPHRKRQQPQSHPFTPTYEVGEIIGQGSYGTVRAATSNNKTYAIKETVCFFLEVDLMTRFAHPNIITMHDFITAPAYDHYSERDTSMYIVMEMGINTLSACHNFDVETIEPIIREMITAVAHLHKNNVYHGDIKLDNFVLCDDPYPDSTDYITKLIDFSLSGYHDTPCNAQTLLAPELYDRYYKSDAEYRSAKYKHISMRATDIWALGESILSLLVRQHRLDFKFSRDDYCNDPDAYLKSCKLTEYYRKLVSRLLHIDPRRRLYRFSSLLRELKIEVAMITEAIAPINTVATDHMEFAEAGKNTIIREGWSCNLEAEVVFLALDLYYRCISNLCQYETTLVAISCVYIAFDLVSNVDHSNGEVKRFIRRCMGGIEIKDVMIMCNVIAQTVRGNLYPPNLYTGVQHISTLQRRWSLLQNITMEKYIKIRKGSSYPHNMRKLRVPLKLL